VHTKADVIAASCTDREIVFVCDLVYASLQSNGGDLESARSWTEEEDAGLARLAGEFELGSDSKNWAGISAAALGRPVMEIRLHSLHSSEKQWSEEEDKRVVAAQKWFGNNFGMIAVYIEGRNDLSIQVRYLWQFAEPKSVLLTLISRSQRRWSKVLQAKAEGMLDEIIKQEVTFFDFLPAKIKRQTWTADEVGLRHFCLAHLRMRIHG
jgi:hypothetical protein